MSTELLVTVDEDTLIVDNDPSTELLVTVDEDILIVESDPDSRSD